MHLDRQCLVILWSCHLVILSSYHLIILSSCHLVILVCPICGVGWVFLCTPQVNHLDSVSFSEDDCTSWLGVTAVVQLAPDS